jgi:ABC-2 type transport system ATP-binding protein
MVLDAHKRFGNRAALAGVSLSAAQGVTTILGPNGAGKTSLLRALATVQDLDGGRITIDGLDASSRPQRTEIRRRLGYLPQDIGFSPRATAFDVVDYLTVLKGWRDARSRRREVWLALDRVGLAARAGERVGALSGGMRQRLGLAQAIVGTPPLIVLDEPSAGFDPAQRLELRTLLSELSRRSTVIVSTHQTDDAAVCSDVVFVLDGGELRFGGTPAHLAALARGRTWRSPVTTGRERAWWRLPNGEFRCIGDPPPDAQIDEPTVEDGYLLLVQRRANAA